MTDPLPEHEQMRGRLAIPSLGIKGPISLRFRCIEQHDCKDAGHGKYLGVSGEPTRPFNTRALHDAGTFIAIAEGELDAISLCESGVPAVAITGSNNWKSHYPRLFSGFDKVYVCGDGDDAGRSFSEKVSRSLSVSVVNVRMRSGEDISDLFIKGGGDLVRTSLGLEAAL